MRWKQRGLGIGVATVLLAAGCGGDSGGTTTVVETTVEEPSSAETTDSAPTTEETDVEPLTSEDFRFKADSICAAYNQAVEKFVAQEAGGYTLNGQKKIDAALGRAIEKLEGLVPPPEMATDYEAFLSALRDGAEGTELGRKEADKRRKAAADELGFQECG